MKKYTGSRKGRLQAFKHFPVKRTINLAEIGEKPINVKLAVPGIAMVLPQAVVSSWTIQENQVSLIVKGSTLQKVNVIVQQLEAEDMVDVCTVATAAGNAEETSVNEVVTAQVTIYLNSGLEEGE